ncbi:MAG: cation-transporting P-type ATPase [Candidatus Aminicenantes bacterium]
MAENKSEGSKRSKDNLPDNPWARKAREILEYFSVSQEQGLTEAQSRKQKKKFGANKLKQTEKKSSWSILIDQVESIVVIVLAAATVASFVLGHLLEGIAISVALLINTLIGFFTELKAVRSIEALQELGKVKTKVRREGTIREIPADEVVPGDILILESGDIVTADLRLVEASKLQADESTLTGESEAVTKTVEPLEEDAPLAERTCMLFKGTSITRGTAEGVASATGMDTEIGNITSLAEEAEEETTPLERRLNQMGKRLIWATLGIMVVVAVAGLLAGRNAVIMLETSVALAIAAIPEGLPIVATLSLARGVRRMVQNNALVNKLSSVETLGATTVIFSDKTGTLTENRMQVKKIQTASGIVDMDKEDTNENDLVREALKVGVLCNNADLSEDPEEHSMGEPLELALLEAGLSLDIKRDELLKSMPEKREVSFDPEVKLMATFHQKNGDCLVAVKGAPEAVLEICDRIKTEENTEQLDEDKKTEWMDKNMGLASEGLRVIALAEKNESSPEAEPYENLVFLGLAGMMDPPRDEARGAIEKCKKAGIRVVMVTGDHAKTAVKIGENVGLASQSSQVMEGRELHDISMEDEDHKGEVIKTQIFARVSPAQKLDLIQIEQEAGEIVAMTGDGVNDAPALKKADIGVAMGKRGTEVAKEASDMILQDDSFSTIVLAVQQGRIIFNNIRKFIYYLLSSNAGKILSVALASFFAVPLPVRPLQILFLNLVTDVFMALALGVGSGDPGIMNKPPRDSREPVLTSTHWIGISGYGLIISLAVVGAVFAGRNWLEMGTEKAVTFSFIALGFASVFHAFNMRNTGSNFFRNEITRNPFVWGSAGLCLALLAAAVYVPGLSDALRTTPLSIQQWSLALGIGLIPFVVGQVLKAFKKLAPFSPS